MKSVNWNVGLKRVFIVLCAIWAIATALALFLIPSNYIFEEKRIPDSTWALWDTTGSDGKPYVAYAPTAADASKWTEDWIMQQKYPNTVEPWKNDPIVLGNVNDPQSDQPLVLSQGEALNVSHLPAHSQDAVIAHFKQEHEKQVKDLHAEQWNTRMWVMITSALLFGIICTVIFTLRWIVLGFRAEKA